MKQKSGKQSNNYSAEKQQCSYSEESKYPEDDGLPTAEQMDAIARLVPQDLPTLTIASLFPTQPPISQLKSTER